jgi:osmotically inducible protein OsmC
VLEVSDTRFIGSSEKEPDILLKSFCSGHKNSKGGLMLLRKARAHWKGAGSQGSGHLTTDSQVLSKTTYSASMRFENQNGTNPEELIAAAHAGCFSMALAFALERAGFHAESLDTEAAVKIEKGSGGWEITSIHLVVKGKVPKIDVTTFKGLAEGAKSGCPVSKALRPAISMDVELRS